ncbi:MAG TPA: FAD:protein FMN transferase [Verrucomicrobiae bacterium]
MGTFVTISVFHTNRTNAERAISAAFDEVRRLNSHLTVHATTSETMRINTTAAKEAVAVSAEFRDSLVSSLRIAQRTEGAFDPTIGPLAQLWGFIWKEYRLPTEEELQRVLPLVNFRNVELRMNEDVATVRFAREGMFLDFGGIGKGYAVDRAIEVLQGQGIWNAMVKAGGDLRVIGVPPEGDGWEVQIEDPLKAGKRKTVFLREGALSTSGNYENYFEVDGVRYSHILNPQTGLPVQGIASCTVTAATCTESDAYATAFFVLGIEKSLKDFSNELAIRFVDEKGRVFQNRSFPSADAK